MTDTPLHTAIREIFAKWAPYPGVGQAYSIERDLLRYADAQAAMTDDERVETMAKAAYGAMRPIAPWNGVTEDVHEIWRRNIRAALAAVPPLAIQAALDAAPAELRADDWRSLWQPRTRDGLDVVHIENMEGNARWALQGVVRWASGGLMISKWTKAGRAWADGGTSPYDLLPIAPEVSDEDVERAWQAFGVQAVGDMRAALASDRAARKGR